MTADIIHNTPTEYISDVVMNSQTPMPIRGYGSSTLPRLFEKLGRLKAECSEIEKYIESLDDSTIRQLLTRRYIEGRTLKETSVLVGYSERQANRILTSFFENMSANVTECP